jgi:hypothetical protein
MLRRLRVTKAIVLHKSLFDAQVTEHLWNNLQGHSRLLPTGQYVLGYERMTLLRAVELPAPAVTFSVTVELMCLVAALAEGMVVPCMVSQVTHTGLSVDMGFALGYVWHAHMGAGGSAFTDHDGPCFTVGEGLGRREIREGTFGWVRVKRARCDAVWGKVHFVAALLSADAADVMPDVADVADVMPDEADVADVMPDVAVAMPDVAVAMPDVAVAMPDAPSVDQAATI